MRDNSINWFVFLLKSEMSKNVLINITNVSHVSRGYYNFTPCYNNYRDNGRYQLTQDSYTPYLGGRSPLPDKYLAVTYK